MHYDALNEIGEKKVDHDEDVILKIDHYMLIKYRVSLIDGSTKL